MPDATDAFRKATRIGAPWLTDASAPMPPPASASTDAWLKDQKEALRQWLSTHVASRMPPDDPGRTAGRWLYDNVVPESVGEAYLLTNALPWGSVTYGTQTMRKLYDPLAVVAPKAKKAALKALDKMEEMAMAQGSAQGVLQARREHRRRGTPLSWRSFMGVE